jgi:response regulator NasT
MAFLVKPFSPQDLLPAIEIALSRHAQLVALESEIQDLGERLETRKLVERAKAVLSEKMKLTEPEAFRWIQKASMDRRLSMADVSRTVLDQLNK